MNPRIKELARQAVVTLRAENTELPPLEEEIVEKILNLREKCDEKFAELIVRECMIVGFNAVYDVEDDSNAVSVYDHIKDHFGID